MALSKTKDKEFGRKEAQAMRRTTSKTTMYWMMCCLMPNSRADDMMGDVQQPLRAS
jgi:hypothetical protein